MCDKIPAKPEINQEVKINKSLQECIAFWNVKFDFVIEYNNKHYYACNNDHVTKKLRFEEEKHNAEVYEVKVNSIYRHSDKILHTFDKKIIEIKEANESLVLNHACVNDKQITSQIEKAPDVKKTGRLSGISAKNRNDLKNFQKNEDKKLKAKWFSSRFFTDQNHLNVMADNILNEMDGKKFGYLVINEITNTSILTLNIQIPQFIFYKQKGTFFWNILLIRQTNKNDELEAVCKKLPDDFSKCQIKKLRSLVNITVSYKKIIEIPGKGATSDIGLEIIRYMLHIGSYCSYCIQKAL
jgi:hypothetical protein